MKPIIAAVCLAALLLPALSACTGPKMPTDRPDDFSFTYYWDNGSLPPPYHYSIILTASAGSGGELSLQLGYDSKEVPPLIETFEISDEQMDELYRIMVDQGVFSRNWQAEDAPPVGGDVEWIEAIAAGETVYIPAFLKAKSAQEAADEIYATVRSLVPRRLWTWVAESYTEYEARY